MQSLLTKAKLLYIYKKKNNTDVPERPKGIGAFEIQSCSVVLSWIEPHDNNAPVEGYLVLYTQPSFAAGEKVVSPTAEEVITLNDLFPGVTYNFTVIAYNAIGNSTPSEAINIKTPEEGNHTHITLNTINSLSTFTAPRGSPQNITATSLSSSSIYVAWEEVLPIDRNGIITTYEVLYEPLETFGLLTRITENTTNLSLLLAGLHPFVNYRISLRAYTSMGSGPYSESILIRTHEDRKP